MILTQKGKKGNQQLLVLFFQFCFVNNANTMNNEKQETHATYMSQSPPSSPPESEPIDPPS
jgi:hypothetical protein